MSLGNVMRGAVLGLALAGFATAADATTFRIDQMTFSGDALTDPGFVVHTNPLTPIQFTLNNPGDRITVDLFEIWSEETAINEDDVDPESFSVNLHFDLPPPGFGGSVPGTTDGGFGFEIFGFFVGVPVPTLTWSDPVHFAFGVDGDLKLRMFDTLFWNNCGDQYDHCRTTVSGKFKLVQDATDVPEPGTIALLGAGLLGLGLLRRRHAA